MAPNALSAARVFFAAFLCLVAVPRGSRAQQNPPPAPPEQTEVVRINTELVQTDVTVLDKEGRFVEGLKQEQFQLRVDGKPVPISFFERIASGSVNEEAQLAAARGSASLAGAKGGDVKPMDRGRTFFFLVDDLHQSFDGLKMAQSFLLDFIDKAMGQNDQVLIGSVSGQVGFLQQLTDNKAVLRAAVARLKLWQRPSTDAQRPPMSENMAMAIEVRHDQDVLDYFTEALVKEGIPRESAETQVRSRAQQILQQSYFITHNTLGSLESLARSAADLPGRKVIFFLSDGFLLDLTEDGTSERLRNITNAAARNQVVVYTMDARGLVAGGMGRASEEIAFDPSGRLSSAVAGDVSAMQEPLRVIAANTGGRALLNSNSLSTGVTRAIKETSVYYLLAWRPEGEAQRGKKFRRIEVKVAGRPDVTVQVRGGFYDTPAQQSAKQSKTPARPPATKTTEDMLREIIKAPYPSKALPTQLDVTYIDVPEKGPYLSASAQIESQFLTFEPAGAKSKAVVDLAGVVFDTQGKPLSAFKDRLEIAVTTTDPEALARRPLIYNFPSHQAPGLYQVRIAVRDAGSGRTGSAARWIEIPDLSTRKLTLSSLVVSEATKEAESAKTDPAAIAKARMSVDHRMDRTSKLRFVTFIYNAARGAGGNEPPDVAVQIQVMRDDQPVLTAPLRKVRHDESADLARIAYAAEVPLESMLPGRYVLQVTVIDRISKTSATQSTNFEVE